MSAPDLGDGNFDRTVVYVLDHDEDGAMGLVLNRPTGVDVADHIEDLHVSLTAPPEFFGGGPVAEAAILALGLRELDTPLEHAVVVDGPVVVVDPEALVAGQTRGVGSVRLYTGYSGWSAGQLEHELALGVWFVAEALPDDVFSSDPESLWRAVMRRQGGKLASIGLYPDDPGLN
ncbi:MAG: YqgE/AlgH family protein [Actinomycetes bacterium]